MRRKKVNKNSNNSSKSRKEPDWLDFIRLKENRNDEFINRRNEIIEHFLFLLDSIADHMARKFPASIHFDDCKQAGYLGLHSAVEAFDPSKNANFIHYASIRIRGSILDFIRSIDPLSRQLRSMQSKFYRAKEELEKKLARTPTDEELIQNLKITKDEYEEYTKRLANFTTLSLHDDCNSDSDNSVLRLDLIEDNHSVNPSTKAEDNEIFGNLMHEFTLKERIVMTLYYKEFLNLKEIGDILELSESRVSQIRSKVLSKLFTKLNEIKKNKRA